MNYTDIIIHKYRKYPGHTILVFDAICKTLSDRMEEVDWSRFDADDWNLLTVMAKTEGVAPLMYWAFKSSEETKDQRRKTAPSGEVAPPSSVPRLAKPTFNALQREYYSTAAYNALLFSELDRVLTALDAADIPVIVLKGAALAQTLYPDPGLRPMSDLDLLVSFERLDHAVQTANDFGYQGDDAVSYWPSLERVLGHHERLQNKKDVNLELHWSLTQAINGDHTLTDWFWEQTQPLSSNSEAQMLSPTSHLMYLSAHLFLGHGAARGLLLWLYDLHLLLADSSNKIDWDALLAQAQRLKWNAPLAAALSQLQDIFEMEIPPEILESLKSHQNTRSQKWVKYKSQPNQSRAWAQWQKWRNLTWYGKLAYSLGNFFPAPAFIRKRYDPNPAWLWPLFYFYRWGDMVLEFVKVLRT